MPRKAATFAAVDPDPTPEEVCEEGSLSVEEASEFAGISLREMESLVAQGAVPSFKHGRRRLVPKRGVVLWQAKLLREQTAEK